MANKNKETTHSDEISRYLARLYAPGRRRYACRAGTPGGVAEWQAAARPALCSLVGLDSIGDERGGHEPSVKVGDAEDCGDYLRHDCVIETEPEVAVPFWLLRPKKDGKFPLAITAHGHDGAGRDTAAGVAHDEDHARQIMDEDRDVAIQAVRKGFVAIAPATRGLGSAFVTDVFNRFNGKDCIAHFIQGLLAGRTSIGERVWDMQRLIDWATGLDYVDGRDILMMGNSGGGVLTAFAAACDERIGIAISSCSFSSFVGINYRMQHHYCNAVPGIMNFGEFWDVAGLIAPRHFLAVHGSHDRMKAMDEVNRAVGELSTIYEAAGASGRFSQVYGDGGHRFFADLMWPFVERALRERGNTSTA